MPKASRKVHLVIVFYGCILPCRRARKRKSQSGANSGLRKTNILWTQSMWSENVYECVRACMLYVQEYMFGDSVYEWMPVYVVCLCPYLYIYIHTHTIYIHTCIHTLQDAHLNSYMWAMSFMTCSEGCAYCVNFVCGVSIPKIQEKRTCTQACMWTQFSAFLILCVSKTPYTLCLRLHNIPYLHLSRHVGSMCACTSSYVLHMKIGHLETSRVSSAQSDALIGSFLCHACIVLFSVYRMYCVYMHTCVD